MSIEGVLVVVIVMGLLLKAFASDNDNGVDLGKIMHARRRK